MSRQLIKSRTEIFPISSVQILVADTTEAERIIIECKTAQMQNAHENLRKGKSLSVGVQS